MSGVALAGRRQDKLDETAAEGVKTNGQSLVVPTDVSDPASVKALFAKTKEAFGRPDQMQIIATKGWSAANPEVAGWLKNFKISQI